MSQTNLYGRVVSPAAVERAVVASLKVWLDGAIGELERVDGWAPGSIVRPLDVVTSSQWEKWPEDQIPVVLVINTGLAGRPTKSHDGIYNATWTVGVSPIVSDVDHDSSRALAAAHAAAIRVALTQHPMLKSSINPDGFAHTIDWAGEDYTDLPFLSSRSLASARVIFDVTVEGVLQTQAGPRTPPADPSVDPGAWPVAEPATTLTAEPVLIGAPVS